MRKLYKVLLLAVAVVAIVACSGCLNFGDTPPKQGLVVTGGK